uniref:Transmembrane protein n=1 Tax=Ditylum brightwellii TaxID=49249 RepID=A0A6U3UR26_9STRA|mmetsp:Transcript_17493/g.26046  ORF Transcript_17493/g.26046 Transcript_17493/m.26046 type:complete len:282 (+) Transcript_17493:63-908(+)
MTTTMRFIPRNNRCTSTLLLQKNLYLSTTSTNTKVCKLNIHRSFSSSLSSSSLSSFPSSLDVSPKFHFTKYTTEQYVQQHRWMSSSSGSSDKTEETPKELEEEEVKSEVLYEGPFASLSLRLKRVSITTAAVSLVGVPLLVALKTGGDIPAVGSMAVGGTAVLAATGSTIALSYCFSPYIQTLERVIVEEKELVKATTRNVMAMQVETIFDPATDVSKPNKGNFRPFCNFMVNGTIPMYVHPELVSDDTLRVQLVGEEEKLSEEEEARQKKLRKDDDDEFL